MKKKIVSLFHLMKIHRIKILLALDLIAVPLMFLFKWMASFMLSTPRPCYFTLMGLQCLTCGGTRCVKNFLNGNFIEAFRMNQLVFILIILSVIIFVLINFAVLFDLGFAKKALKKIFSIPGLIIFLVLLVGFYVGRNVDNFIIILKTVAENSA